MDKNTEELKTHVDEQTKEDFGFLCRAMGFKTNSEFLRYLVIREVKGVIPQLQIKTSFGVNGRANNGQQEG